MNKKLITASLFALSLALPFTAWATPGIVTNISGVMTSVLNLIWPFFIGLAIIMFIVAGVYFLTDQPDKGRSALLWGVVGVIVGILAFSLPIIIGNTLGTGLGL